eukprot:15483343-Alexandrium_andersonii.AAC.1
MPVSAAIRLNLQAATRKTQNHFRRSNLELRGPRGGLNFGPRGSRGVRSGQLFVEIPNPLAKWVVEG